MKERRFLVPLGIGVVLMLIALAWWGVATASADAPTVILYQGRLTDDSGRPVNDTLSMTFALYAVPEGGMPAWVEAHPAITVTDGLLTAYLGESVPLSSGVLNDNHYLGLTVGSDSEMTPRQRLASEPYARTLAPGAAISGSAGPWEAVVSITNTAFRVNASSALRLHSIDGSGPVLQVTLDPEEGWDGAVASAIYARRTSRTIWGWPTIQTTSYGGTPGLAANSTDGTALFGVAGDPGTSGSPAGGPFQGWYTTFPSAKAGVLGYSTIGPGGYFTATNTGLYATSLEGPAIEADLWVTGEGTHGFNHTVVATNGSTHGHAAILGSNVSTGLYGGGPGVYGNSQQGSGVLGEAGRSGTGPIQDPLKSLSASTGAGVMGYSTVGPGVYATSTVTYSLYVDGDAYFTGNGYFAGDVITNADIAENYYATDSLEPGDVVVLDPDTFLGVRRADRAYDTAAAGVISSRPAIRIQGRIEDNQGAPLALIGRVPAKADANYGAISVGDLLTTSPTPGHAMRCADRLQCVGAIIGKALEPLDNGTGVILALVTLQ